MAVSKRVRYEIFRRDNKTCRYCGATAPDVRITIDHVVPVALGGDDKPSNLVTACFDCNLGKGSSSPDESTVAQVSDDAMRYARLVKQAWEVKLEAVYKEHEFADAAADVIKFPKPADWRSSVGQFYALGVPLEAIEEAARLASEKWSYSGSLDRFKYMCGILWNQTREVGAAVAESIDMDGCWYTDSDIEDIKIDAGSDGHDLGKRVGRIDGYRKGWSDGLKHPDPVTGLLHHAIEGSYPFFAKKWVDGRQALAACG